jgi:hypothetical protein
MNEEPIETGETHDQDPDDDPAQPTTETGTEAMIREAFPGWDPRVVARVLGLALAESWDDPEGSDPLVDAAQDEVDDDH